MQVLLPELGGRKTEAILIRWIPDDGNRVKEGEQLYEVEYNKMTVTLPAPAAGVFHMRVKDGARVKYGQLLAEIEEDA